VLIVDEASMLDVYITRTLLRALPSPADRRVFVLFVGDADQLPSVGPGRVLGDLISSGTVATTHLQRVFRQAASSSIVFNAHMINKGKLPERMWAIRSSTPAATDPAKKTVYPWVSLADVVTRSAATPTHSRA
jgi:ATP-dependent exoDNAse (exonuclease V) alpha subunit